MKRPEGVDALREEALGAHRPARPVLEPGATEMAVGQEGAHAQLLGEGGSLPERGLGRDRCLVCGGVFRQLTNTHLRGHRMPAEKYKRRFGYDRGRPLMCRALRRLYADRAVKNRMASRIRQRPILVRPELRRQGGTRTIALEELLTRRDVRRGRRELHAAI
ncbi:MAG: MucR family transcriptional regulator [Candidatus Rokuibacteriota bacterium]